jgi:hypothetical protein
VILASRLEKSTRLGLLESEKRVSDFPGRVFFARCFKFHFRYHDDPSQHPLMPTIVRLPRHIFLRPAFCGVSALSSYCLMLSLTLAVLTPLMAEEPAKLPNKKGLQVQMIDDALALGIHHAALNLDVTRLVDPVARPTSIKWKSGGREFYFNERVVADLDHRVKPLSEAGVVVYVILLPYASGDVARNTLMVHPAYARGGKDTGPIGMFNIATPEGIAWLTAASEFLAHRYCGPQTPQGRVWGFIVGNEVNSHWYWANMGRATLAQVVEAYEKSVRIVHTAVRAVSTEARVYLSLEHFWAKRYPAGDEQQSVPGRALLEAFAKLARQKGDFDWHLAYHPYPEPLTDPRFWLDQKNAPQSPDATTITFRNLEVLSRYLDQADMHWKGKPRRVILSEQGFHSTNRRNGEQVQAAAYALAYTKVAGMPGIDAFILHRHVDHAQEGGLRLGLWTNKPGTMATPERKRPMYEVFRAAGTPEQEKAFGFALPIVGAKSWPEALQMMEHP